ncbi:MAG TPA: GYD domain-containing protein [Gemmataceae bacterium]|nr:GYD domain-containing protein [Gemmataceae bacterium]
MPMATFITTMHFTEQGIKVVRDTCDRAALFKATAKKMGVKVTGQYWTLGAFDGVIVCEAPDEATATAALLHLGTLGNIRTQTARAFDAAEIQKILGLLPK